MLPSVRKGVWLTVLAVICSLVFLRSRQLSCMCCYKMSVQCGHCALLNSTVNFIMSFNLWTNTLHSSASCTRYPETKLLSVWQLWCLYSQSSLIIICILCCGFWRSLWRAGLLHIWLCSCVIGSVLVAVWQKTVYLFPALCRCNGYFWVGKGDFFNSVNILSRILKGIRFLPAFQPDLLYSTCLFSEPNLMIRWLWSKSKW